MAQKPGVQMTKQRAKLLEEISNGASIAEAGRAAGYGSRQAAHDAYLRIRKYIPEALTEKGMPLDRFLTKLIEKTEAKETKFFAHNGIVMDHRDVDAHAIQLEALRDIGKLYDAYPRREDGLESGAQPGSITVNLAFLGPKTAERVLIAAGARPSRGGSRQPVLDAKRDNNEG